MEKANEVYMKASILNSHLSGESHKGELILETFNEIKEYHDGLYRGLSIDESTLFTSESFGYSYTTHMSIAEDFALSGITKGHVPIVVKLAMGFGVSRVKALDTTRDSIEELFDTVSVDSKEWILLVDAERMVNKYEKLAEGEKEVIIEQNHKEVLHVSDKDECSLMMVELSN